MNVKIYIQGAFNSHYVRCKDLVKKDTGDVFTRSPRDLNDVLDFDEVQMTDEERLSKTRKMFAEFIMPFAEKALSIAGIWELKEQGLVFLLPPVEQELLRLTDTNKPVFDPKSLDHFKPTAAPIIQYGFYNPSDNAS